MSGDVQPYLDLITSEHQGQPNYAAFLTMMVQGFADEQSVMNSMPGLYDFDVSAGVQLDADGLWIGQSRYLAVALTGVYFAFDTVGVGFDQGTWWTPFDPLTTLTRLPDDAYRTLLRAKIAENQWDGTVPGAYLALEPVFAPFGAQIIIQDNQDMTMTYALLGDNVDAITLALFTGGFLALKPAGVRIDEFLTPSLPATPFFGFDIESDLISGFDVGAWGAISPGV